MTVMVLWTLYKTLRILDSYDAKVVKIRKFWTLGPVIQLINHLFKIRQKAFLPNNHRCKKCGDIKMPLQFLHPWSRGLRNVLWTAPCPHNSYSILFDHRIPFFHLSTGMTNECGHTKQAKLHLVEYTSNQLT